jgi:metallophosphoesterase (TIGR00282 family)
MKTVRAVMIGDVVGEPGLEVLEEALPVLIRENAADFVVVNGENAAEGFGLTGAALGRILAAGADVVTSGNHIWEKREFWPALDAESRVLRPANYPPGAAGRGWVRIDKAPAGGGDPVAWVVVNLQGRELMTPIDCPFKAFDKILEALGPGGNFLALVDFHAESSREKEALAYYLDGRACVVAGTHTHAQTADQRILPRGAAYITDLGMTGAVDGIIGMDPEICLNRARRQILYRMECAKPGPEGAALQGLMAEIDRETGKALSVTRINRRGSGPSTGIPG